MIKTQHKIINIIIAIIIVFSFTNSYAKWWAEAKCSLKSLTNETEHLNGSIVYGRGSGKTKSEAEKNAIKDVNSNYVPEGTQAKHCRITNSFYQKFIKILKGLF